MSTKLSDKIDVMIRQAFDAVEMGDEVTWDYTILANEQGNFMHFYSWLPGVVLGSAIRSFAVVPDPYHLTPEAAENLARETIEALRTARSQQATMPNGSPHGPPEVIPPRHQTG